MRYPKTLVLTESPFSSTNGFGVTLATLFAEWPLESFFVLYRSRRFWDDTCVQLQEARDRMIHMPLPGKPLLNPVHVRELSGVLLPYLLGRTPSWMGKYSRRWIAEALSGWQPDVIYCWYYSPVVAHYGSWLSNELGVPQVIHVGDVAPVEETDQAMLRVVRKAAGRIAISGEMKRDLEAHFGVAFDVVHNGASEEIFAPPSAQPEHDGTLVVRYLGSLLRAHHWNAIEDIVEAIRLYNQKGGSARFELYCPEWTVNLARELEDSENVVYAGFAEKPKNYELLKSADLLVLPITFDEEESRWVRLSMPTKLPEYLGSGTPTLVYGPRGCAPVEFCIEHGVGIVRTERSVASLVNTLEELSANRQEARERARRDQRIAEAEVSARVMSERLRLILEGAAAAADAGGHGSSGLAGNGIGR